MKKKPFLFPMRVYERVIGIIYIPVHAYLLPLIITLIAAVAGWNIDYPTLNLVYYAFSSLFLLFALNRYWRATMHDLTTAPIRALQAVILGFVLYFFANYLTSIVMSLFTTDVINPNTAAVNETMAINSDMMIVVMVLLAPIAEETMFRGALFGTIRQKSRVLAYVVSSLLFALYHLWSYAFAGGTGVLIYMVQYIPAALALAWCYEWSGSLVAPVVMHALVNLIASIDVIWR